MIHEIAKVQSLSFLYIVYIFRLSNEPRSDILTYMVRHQHHYKRQTFIKDLFLQGLPVQEFCCIKGLTTTAGSVDTARYTQLLGSDLDSVKGFQKPTQTYQFPSTTNLNQIKLQTENVFNIFPGSLSTSTRYTQILGSDLDSEKTSKTNANIVITENVFFCYYGKAVKTQQGLPIM